MKVWERIGQIINVSIKDEVSRWMQDNEMSPCDVNSNIFLVGSERMDELCGRHMVGCLDCMNDYLEGEL